jgi:hypothetical protein
MMREQIINTIEKEKIIVIVRGVEKEKLIDTFINKIFVYDDKIKIIYNVNGKEENITLEELESSNFEQHAQPSKEKTNNSWCFSFAVGHPTEMNFPSNTLCCVVDAHTQINLLLSHCPSMWVSQGRASVI